MLRRLAEIHWLAGCVGRRPARRIDKTHMNVNPIADELRVGFGREDHALPQPLCGGARHLAGDHRVIGGGQGRLRHHGHLELARAVLGEKGIGDHPGRPQRRDETLAKGALAAKGAEGVGVARTVRRPGVDEFLLECRDQAEARDLFELSDCAAQEIAGAAFPNATVGIADVAQKEMLDRRAVGKIDPHFDGGVGHDHEIPGGAERRVPDRPER